METTDETERRDIWLSLPSTASQTIVDIRASSNPRILLYPLATDEPPTYEIELGAKGNTATQIYDKRRRGTSESASHDVPI